MPTERATLRTRSGQASDAQAEVVRYGRALRLGGAVVIAVGGVVIGLSTVIIPAVHLFAPWAIPLLTLGIAFYVASLRGRVDGVSGPCPACGGAVVQGRLGVLGDEALWIRCGPCGAPLEVVLRSAP